MKKYKYVLAALALVCILGASIKSAVSYFTTYAEARGGVTLNLVEETQITENVSPGEKKLVIHNNDADVAVYVRVKAYAYIDGEDAIIEESCIGDDNWEQGTDENGQRCWYYKKILEPNADTTEMTIAFKMPEEKNLGDEYNVVVLYESAPVQYDENGDALAYNDEAIWSQSLITETEGGN